MESVTVFNFEQMNVRTVVIDNEPYFVGKDVADVLGYKRTADALKQHVDIEDKGVGEIQTPGGIQNMTVINESGVYSLIFGSKLDSAKRFKKWVTTDVLPSIRKNGAYLTNEKIEEVLTNPDTLISLATQLKEERNQKLMLQQQVAESRPKADYYDRIMKSKSLVTISQIAEDYGWSAQRTNAKLHELGVQHKVGGQWLMYAKHKNHGYTFSETQDISQIVGKDKVVMNTKWTQKGRVFIYTLLKNKGILPTIERDDVA
ncbi:phage antirepressor KilAC domain-containing protein [Weissella diestrammenae]|uniref:Phage antirepressor KilAC domain-containing protein n=1 Tax=Weissella diestrammenae TaxID=1162633 RepID=A0A7G9T4G0_9LACO|nr:phage antirepressor [Weissella diestrammenae]MCM0583521.1 phage antirepressor [Weissella diestrammenae]QNN74985.1 phage antirepressor KilAC domain-containing protein [Weissella diestrammenae]